MTSHQSRPFPGGFRMPDITRRHALGAAAALAVTVGAPLSVAVADDHDGHDGLGGHDRHRAPEAFDEGYRGRRIEGRATDGGGHHHGAGYAVFVDGVELHVMRNADGG